MRKDAAGILICPSGCANGCKWQRCSTKEWPWWRQSKGVYFGNHGMIPLPSLIPFLAQYCRCCEHQLCPKCPKRSRLSSIVETRTVL
ncbi:hypothetical protein GE21DRAFT_1122002 [Neurospora crassa]|nr:hypothetical protein GE21DRAFT_1122002 [Neurospora crassa]